MCRRPNLGNLNVSALARTSASVPAPNALGFVKGTGSSLLAMRAADVRAALPATTLRINFYFLPNASRVGASSSIRFSGPSVLMVVIGYDELSSELKAAAVRLSEWLSESVFEATNTTGNAVPGSEVNKEWSITWQQFSQVLAIYTCPKMNTPARSVVDGRRVPYVVSRFEQRLLDDDGSQMVSIEFAVYEDLLAAWLSNPN